MLKLLKYSFLITAFLFSSCSLQKLLGLEPGSPPPAAPTKIAHTFCVACHGTEKPQPGKPVFASGIDPSAACLECHDYKENHHPVDFVPADSSRMPFRLFEGKMTCLTCHEIHGGDKKEGTPKLLRGGPYQDRRQICFRCHVEENYLGINPHQMMDDNNKVREVNGKPVCLLCHSKVPNPETDLTGDVRFRADIGFLCWRCHPPMPDPFFNTHFLVTPSKTTLDFIHNAEITSDVVIPLVPRGRITCSTCHNPHQKGVIQREAAAKGAGSRAKLRMQQLCSACHSY
jgi:predicted CXXCH cytochrome family protein